MVALQSVLPGQRTNVGQQALRAEVLDIKLVIAVLHQVVRPNIVKQGALFLQRSDYFVVLCKQPGNPFSVAYFGMQVCFHRVESASSALVGEEFEELIAIVFDDTSREILDGLGQDGVVQSALQKIRCLDQALLTDGG